MAEYNGKTGVWRTIGGRRVFIPDGQDLSEAMKESGKFKKKDEDEFDRDEYEDYESAKDFEDELGIDYSPEEWARLEKKYSKIYKEKKDYRWYMRVKSEPALADMYSNSEKFKKLDKKYNKEWEKEQEKIRKSTIEAVELLNARDKEKEERKKKGDY